MLLHNTPKIWCVAEAPEQLYVCLDRMSAETIFSLKLENGGNIYEASPLLHVEEKYKQKGTNEAQTIGTIFHSYHEGSVMYNMASFVQERGEDSVKDKLSTNNGDRFKNSKAHSYSISPVLLVFYQWKGAQTKIKRNHNCAQMK